MTIQIGERLKQARLKAGLSIEETARRLDTDYSYLIRIEKGHATPNLETVKKLADFYGVPLYELFSSELDNLQSSLLNDLNANVKFSEVLKKYNKDKCPNCNKLIDRGDVQWNNANNENGTGYSVLEIICERCFTEIVYLQSWSYIDDFDAFVEILESEL
jgi:transcriptional regulator with XRE-family HTH domain